jgi:hypothetical protein
MSRRAITFEKSSGNVEAKPNRRQRAILSVV